MKMGSFVGGAAAGYMAGKRVKDRMKKADEQPAAPISVSVESTPVDTAQAVYDGTQPGMADGGMVGRNRWYGKKPCP